MRRSLTFHLTKCRQVRVILASCSPSRLQRRSRNLTQTGMKEGALPRFAANLTMLFNEVPFMERFAAAAKAGFKGVEYLFPYDFAAEDLAKQLSTHGLTQVLHNLPAGDWGKGERGIAIFPDRVDERRYQAPDRADQHPRHSGLLPDPHQASARPHRRSGIGQPLRPVRYLSHADHGGRSGPHDGG